MSVAGFNSKIDYQFIDYALLDQAVTHRSVSRTINNERLEFLGDSVLSLVISEYLYKYFPDIDEGKLSRLRASLVNQQSLAMIARGISLGECIKLGGGELKSGGFRRDSILSDTLEAIIGAIYLDGGFQQACKSVRYLYRNMLTEITDKIDQSLKDPKTQLQEILQSRQIQLPEYQVIQTVGKDHDQVFTVSCKIHVLEIEATGKGSSRKKAEQEAAGQVLKRLN
ncbi:MAG: ribonuclease III [Gammaproteobacteria bacterium]|nr:ribonuclease III [Gammaproteobacteria bacterium]